MMISVDFTPMALNNPTDPSTESMTSRTPQRPSNTWNPTIHITQMIESLTFNVGSWVFMAMSLLAIYDSLHFYATTCTDSMHRLSYFNGIKQFVMEYKPY